MEMYSLVLMDITALVIWGILCRFGAAKGANLFLGLSFLCQAGYVYFANPGEGIRFGAHLLVGAVALIFYARLQIHDLSWSRKVKAAAVPRDQVAGEYCAWMNRDGERKE